MTAAQVRNLRSALKLTQYEFGRMIYLGGDNPERVVRRWESGSQDISGPARKALEMIAKERGIRIR